MIDIDALLTVIFIFLPIVFALLCLYYAFHFLKAARNLEDNPTSKIRSAAQGYVELSGTAKALLTQAIPGKLTQKPCAWYRYTIEEWTTTQSNSEPQSSWQLLEQGVSLDPFLIEDGTGECVILPKGADIIPTTAISWRGHMRKADPPPTSFLIWLFWNSWGRYRYTEYRLELQRPLFVHGMFITLNSTDPLIEGDPILQLYCREKKISTLNLLLKEGLSQNEHFIVSALSESRLTRQFRVKALLFFIAFLFFVALSFNSTYPIIKKSLQEWQLKSLRVFYSSL